MKPVKRTSRCNWSCSRLVAGDARVSKSISRRPIIEQNDFVGVHEQENPQLIKIKFKSNQPSQKIRLDENKDKVYLLAVPFRKRFWRRSSFFTICVKKNNCFYGGGVVSGKRPVILGYLWALFFLRTVTLNIFS